MRWMPSSWTLQSSNGHVRKLRRKWNNTKKVEGRSASVIKKNSEKVAKGKDHSHHQNKRDKSNIRQRLISQLEAKKGKTWKWGKELEEKKEVELTLSSPRGGQGADLHRLHKVNGAHSTFMSPTQPA